MVTHQCENSQPHDPHDGRSADGSGAIELHCPGRQGSTTLFHVEMQEVIYRTYSVEAEDKAAARQLAVDGKVDEAVGRHLQSLLPTTVHQVEDACAKRDCYKQPDNG